jgi:hypothetical protein
VNVKDGAVIEPKELVLAAPLHAYYPSLSQEARSCGWKLARERRMERARGRNRLPFDGCAEPAHCSLDFG